jgi:hypothetical protein
MNRTSLETYLHTWHPSARVVTWCESGWWQAEVVTDHGQLPPHGGGMTEAESIQRLAVNVLKWVG